jgi:hypothetical protein
MLHPARLVVHNFDPTSYLPSVLYKRLVRGVLVHVVVAVFCILELNDEAVGEVTLHLSTVWRVDYEGVDARRGLRDCCSSRLRMILCRAFGRWGGCIGLLG